MTMIYFVKPPNVFTALKAIYTVIASARPLIVQGHVAVL